MKTIACVITASLLALLVHAAAPATALPESCSVAGENLTFSGLTWTVKNKLDDPEQNTFRADNVVCDADGSLHLKITNRSGLWTAAEISTTDAHGFGSYQFQVEGPLASLDPRVVLGLFLYEDPTAFKYNEIDIEFAKWNDSGRPPGGFTVWPALSHAPPSADCARADQRPELLLSNLGHGLVGDAADGVREPLHCTHTHDVAFTGAASTHRIDWQPDHVSFESLDGLRDDEQALVAAWTFAPLAPHVYVPQEPMSVHLNLYLLGGAEPLDGHEVDIVVRGVRVP